MRGAGFSGRVGISAPWCVGSRSSLPSPRARSRRVLCEPGTSSWSAADGAPVGKSSARPSAETPLHLAVVRERAAGAVLHTHSVWSTVLSEPTAPSGGLRLSRIRDAQRARRRPHARAHANGCPSSTTTRTSPALARRVEALLEQLAGVHGFLLRGHGLYTWGDDLAQAQTPRRDSRVPARNLSGRMEAAWRRPWL